MSHVELFNIKKHFKSPYIIIGLILIVFNVALLISARFWDLGFFINLFFTPFIMSLVYIWDSIWRQNRKITRIFSIIIITVIPSIVAFIVTVLSYQISPEFIGLDHNPPFMYYLVLGGFKFSLIACVLSQIAVVFLRAFNKMQ